jgi:hypothetical protein
VHPADGTEQQGLAERDVVEAGEVGGVREGLRLVELPRPEQLARRQPHQPDVQAFQLGAVARFSTHMVLATPA